MGNIIFNVLWCALAGWTCFVPNGYGPYIMLGFNIGDFMATLYCAFDRGYLEEEGDFNFGRFLLATLGFALLGGFYLGGLSFQPGSDAYNNAMLVIFFTFMLTFLYRYVQYYLIPLIKK